MNLFSNKKNRGFTLIESLVAVAVLSTSILGAFTAVQSSLRNSISTKDQITAFYLIQEAMEFIKNTRDENALYTIANPSTPRSWLYGLSSATADPCWYGGGGTNQKVCRIDSPNKTTVYCGDAFGSCPLLKQDSVTRLFGHSAGWTDTIFRREIQFTNISLDREVVVRIRVSWTNRGVSKTVEVSQTLFNR